MSDVSDGRNTLARALAAPHALGQDDFVHFLTTADPAEREALFAAARAVRAACGRDAVLPRGLVECSNICAKNCLYCGVRKGHAAVVRYRLAEEDVLACCDEAARRGYPAVAFQAGEVESEANTAYYERLLKAVSGRFEVTLSLGEQAEEVYRRWKEAGAMRYLLRIESSDRDLFAKIHPADCSYDRRLACLRALRRLGYVTGTGVMVGLPGQTVAHLAADLAFFVRERVDMVGMGPYVPHPATPLARAAESIPPPHVRVELTLRMIALARLALHDVNIVAATALEALDPAGGRAAGLRAGANVVMPVLTPPHDRAKYDLYPGKAEAASP